MTQNPGGLYVMMIIWAGIYFGVGAVFEYLEPHRFIVQLIIDATHETRSVAAWVADPNYNFTMAQMREGVIERLGFTPSAGVEGESVSIVRWSETLPWDTEGRTLAMELSNMLRYINRHADTVWGTFCVVGCFLGLMGVHKVRADNGVHGIPEFKDIQ